MTHEQLNDDAFQVGLVLPMSEGMFNGTTARWNDLRVLTTTAESVGFDSIWLIDHLLIPVGDFIDGEAPVGDWECWTTLAALAAVTSSIQLGTYVTCTTFRNPALLAKMADTVDEICGGRFVLGLGAGSVSGELPTFGYSSDHPVDRFEEAVQIISGLLRDGHVDFDGRYYTMRECELRPRGPQPNGLRVMIGSRRPRMDRLAARYADIWNGSWHNRAALLRPRMEAVDAACIEIGRDPTSLKRTAGVMIDLPGLDVQPEWPWGNFMRKPAMPLSGSLVQIEAELMAYRQLGVSHLHLWLNPISPETITSFASILKRLSGQTSC